MTNDMKVGAVKELRVTMRVSNNRIKRMREERGFSARAASTAAGVKYASWLDYEALRTKPFGCRRGFDRRLDWTVVAKKIAAFLGVTPDWLWPEATLAVVQPTVVAEIDAEDLAPQLVAAQIRPALPSPDEADAWKDDVRRLERCLRQLSPRGERILRDRFGLSHPERDGGEGGEKTTVEVAASLGISRGRVNFLESSAMDRLKYLILKDEAEDETPQIRLVEGRIVRQRPAWVGVRK